jgi:hypothetical protein
MWKILVDLLSLIIALNQNGKLRGEYFMKRVDLSGQTFNHLTVIKRVEDYVSPNGVHQAKYLCKCECGNEVTVLGYSLKNNITISCGCKSKYRSKWQKEFGCKGITYSKAANKNIAHVYLGYFNTAEEAAKAVKEAEAKLNSDSQMEN